MSFEKLKVSELQGVAETFGFGDEAKGLKKQELIDLLTAEGVTYGQYQTFVNAGKDEEEEVDGLPDIDLDSLVLIKMDRPNPSFEIKAPSGRTYHFTLRHPFRPVPEDDADFIFDTEQGFRLATPKEAKSFYA